MGQAAYLAPVGPFAGLSNSARRKISDRFPSLSLAEVESATASFLDELQAPGIEPRLMQAREKLNSFARELERFHCALNQMRTHRLHQAIGEVSRMITGENEFEFFEHSLENVRAAIHQTSRVLPAGQAELAVKRLIAALARRVKLAGLPVDTASGGSLLSLVDLIFDDLMVGGDAAGAVREWLRSQATNVDHDRATMLLDLVP